MASKKSKPTKDAARVAAGIKAAATRARNKREAERAAQRRSDAAKRGAATRARNKLEGERAAKKRSDAAKRGAATRRKNAAKNPATRKPAPRKPAAKLRKGTSLRAQLEAEIRAELAAKARKKARKKASKKKLAAARAEWVEIGNVNQYRGTPGAELVYVTMRMAQKNGTLDAAAARLSAELGLSIREVYTLFFSP